MSGVSEDFVRELTAHHNRLLAFITSLVGDYATACDVLQETNVELWRKAEDFEPGTNFFGWACTIAKYKVLQMRSKQRRDRLVFDDALVETLASEAEEHSAVCGEYGDALADCLAQLSPRQRDLIQQRYKDDASLGDLAQKVGRTASSLGVTLFRIRQALLECIQRKQAATK